MVIRLNTNQEFAGKASEVAKYQHHNKIWFKVENQDAEIQQDKESLWRFKTLEWKTQDVVKQRLSLVMEVSSDEALEGGWKGNALGCDREQENVLQQEAGFSWASEQLSCYFPQPFLNQSTLAIIPGFCSAGGQSSFSSSMVLESVNLSDGSYAILSLCQDSTVTQGL